ncbi:unnamed protein product, partial [Allacma fusca]
MDLEKLEWELKRLSSCDKNRGRPIYSCFSAGSNVTGVLTDDGYHLHQNFVVALLNDIFGIHCRGGCMCAGPDAQIILDISIDTAKQYEAAP